MRISLAGRLAAPVISLLLLGGLVLTGCGIPLSNAAQPLNAKIPQDLLPATSTTSTTTTVPDTPNAVPIAVYFLDPAGTNLVKTIADEPGPATAAEALGLLTYGPTAADSKLGYTTALSTSPQATPSVKVNLKTGIATVALDNSTEALIGVPLYEALAQIVYTVTDPKFGVVSVVFTYAGSGIDAYLPNGTEPQGPVTRQDYAELAPLPVAAAPTSALHHAQVKSNASQ